ncbi:Fe-S oxidoreductase [Clostridium sp. MCC353]|uniref:aldo/keto reductase n=1 Tax=Clostridium sp. MCC353 TaxID=2592646 RepID=UPI001C01C70A|nr:aldo/keto reductase [Clostridium sp. MCC353]MBT9775895.1 Fe-S oxidoreductase [Clostridium sp. MCC353]
MAKGNLGFGLMRLPQLSAEAKDIDYEQLNKMVDLFLESGFDYFDTSWVYHDGESEAAIRKCLVDRYPRGKFRLASKLPIFAITEETQVEEIFEQQLTRCGVEYFDYYLLHNVNEMRYQKIVSGMHMFDYMKKWKEEGKIRHIAFSHHDSAEILDQILNEHPETEAVQIALNYIDWNAYFIQAKACYDVIRKHGKQVIVMEPVKGGMLATAPEAAEQLMKAEKPEASIASWALRYAAGMDGVLTVLSGMSTLEQVEDNVSNMKEFQSLSEKEREILQQVARIYRESGPAKTADFTSYEKISPKGISAAAILDCYNSCMLQPVPTFGAEHNYFTSEKARHGLFKEDLCIPGKVILEDGRDMTELVHRAEAFLNENSFF